MGRVTRSSSTGVFVLVVCVTSFADPSSVTIRAFGWLYEHHPRTAIANLSQLAAPVCVIKSQPTQLTHGYWKDLLNILALATVDQFGVYPAPFLHVPRGRYSGNRSVGPSKMTHAERRSNMTPEERDALLTAKNEKAKAHARELRVKSAADAHALLLSRLSEPRFCALYIAVARLFANELVGQTALMRKAEALPGGEERNRISREVSLVGKCHAWCFARQSDQYLYGNRNSPASQRRHVVPLPANRHLECCVDRRCSRAPLVLSTLGTHTSTRCRSCARTAYGRGSMGRCLVAHQRQALHQA